MQNGEKKGRKVLTRTVNGDYEDPENENYSLTSLHNMLSQPPVLKQGLVISLRFDSLVK